MAKNRKKVTRAQKIERAKLELLQAPVVAAKREQIQAEKDEGIIKRFIRLRRKIDGSNKYMEELRYKLENPRPDGDDEDDRRDEDALNKEEIHNSDFYDELSELQENYPELYSIAKERMAGQDASEREAQLKLEREADKARLLEYRKAMPAISRKLRFVIGNEFLSADGDWNAWENNIATPALTSLGYGEIIWCNKEFSDGRKVRMADTMFDNRRFCLFYDEYQAK